MKVYLSDIYQVSGLAATVCASTQVDVNGLFCVLYVCKERAIAENVHCALVVEKNSSWIKVSCVIIHVVRYLVKACAWRGIGVVAIFVVGIGVVFCFSVALVCLVVHVHT